MKPHVRNHTLGGDKHLSDTLANLNSKISDATLGDADDFCEETFEVSVFIPVEDFIDGDYAPSALTTISSGVGQDKVRDFAGATQDEDVVIPWTVPRDIDTTEGIKFRVIGYITAEVDPAVDTQGVVFGLQGYSLGIGDPLGGAFGVVQVSTVTDLFARGCVQFDYWTTSDSPVITVTDLTAGERVIFKLYRDQDHASDTYAQEIGVAGIVLTYSITPEPT